MTKHTISKKQTEILSLLYKFRFLNRKQIQTMLAHKYPSRIFSWLDDLTLNDYLSCTYEKNFDNLPAIYSLGKNGRKYLKNTIGKSKQLERARKSKCSKRFINHSIFIGNIYLSLFRFTKENKSKLHFYTKSDLSDIEHLISPCPDVYFAIEDRTGNVKRYFLEIFNENLRTNILRNRTKAYLTYYESDDWQDNTDKPFPEIILICPTTKLKNHLYYYIREKLDEDDHPNIYLAAKESVQEKGLTREVLEKINPKG
jgi:hypothetical protein